MDKVLKHDQEKLMELVLSGEWLSTDNVFQNSNRIARAEDIHTLPIAILSQSLENLLDWRAKFNAEQRYPEFKKMDRESDIVKKFFELLNSVKESYDSGSFTDTFEKNIQLRMFIEMNKKRLNAFTGDGDLNLIFRAISLKLTSIQFDVLEALERENKAMFLFKNKLELK